MKKTRPRHGSMQFWPRVRAKRAYASIRSWLRPLKEAKPMGFAGYKAGMTHIMLSDNRPNSITKNQTITMPVTVIECPPLKIYGARFYKKRLYGLNAYTDIVMKTDKDLQKKIITSKKDNSSKLNDLKPEDFSDIRLLVYTQPKLTNIGNKKPSLFELGLGGSMQDKFNFVKENLGKELSVKNILAEGQQLDFCTVTKGKGFQGPVKRFGVDIRSHKSEKTKRGPGAICGGWKSQGHMMYRTAHAGDMGFHKRTDYNKWLLMIGDDAKTINPKGGFKKYGEVKNNYILIKGSVGGSIKRLIRFNQAIRPNKRIPPQAPPIEYISLESKQGR